MRDLLFVAIVLTCALLAVGKPFFGLLSYVAGSLLNLQSMTWGWAQTFPFAQCLAIGTLLGLVFSAKTKRFPKQRELFLLLMLWGFFAITTITALEPDLALERLLYTSKILLMVFVSMILIDSPDKLMQLMRVIALSLGFFGLKGGIFALASGGNFMVWGPERSFLAANNSIGLALVMNIPILFHLLRVETNKRLRWLECAMLLFSYPAVVCTFSRGAWLGLGVVTGLIIWRSRHRVLALVAIVVLIPLSIPFLPERVIFRFGQLENFEEESSAQSRLWNWEFCGRVGLARPLTGAGFNYYSAEAYATFFPEFLTRWPGKVWTCHSAWFTILGEHGFPGFMIWLALLGCCLLSLRRMRQYCVRHSEAASFLELYGMLMGAFLGYMVAGTFLDVAYFDLFYQLIAVTILAKELLPEAFEQVRFEHPTMVLEPLESATRRT